MKLKIDPHIFTRIDIHRNIHGDDAIVLKTILDSHLDALEKQDGALYSFPISQVPNQWIPRG